MDPKTIDGNASLEQQQDTLNFTENMSGVKTVSYVRADPANSHLNLATFEDVPLTETVPPIKLTESANGSDIWVSGVIKKVALSR